MLLAKPRHLNINSTDEGTSLSRRASLGDHLMISKTLTKRTSNNIYKNFVLRKKSIHCGYVSFPESTKERKNKKAKINDFSCLIVQWKI